MITINSYIHRSLLCDIIRRWMFNELRAADGDSVTRLVHFNSAYVSRYLDRFSREILEALYGKGLASRPVSLKGDLKDALIAHPPYRNARIDELVRDYRDNPGRFYRETPFHGTLYFREEEGGARYLASSRIKRVRRLAEKGARRIVDQIFRNIREQAALLAEERARYLGIPRSHLVTSPEDMQAEFLRAENRILEDLKNRKPLVGMGAPVINDVAGVKIIMESGDQERLKEVLTAGERFDIVEEEKHKGRYNATNFIVRYTPPKKEIAGIPLGNDVLRFLSARGWNGGKVNDAFREFIVTGEQSVHIEIIVSTYQETLESEIGRSMHEDRILEQRMSRQYRGPLAANVEYLMEYLFLFPYSRQKEIRELPIRIWNRYLPDYFDEVIKNLFRIPVAGILA
ncbi:MAG TPA: hypothetical protein PKY58_05570 [Syntrophales bacterium]|nr:hypothetical protein [Syntrophales bacterium]HQN78024.1 hypothetical protein [Syntrophales bacterium]HQQ26977.1 hypothetical protein [Syntrophales bacterium]